MMGHAVRDLGGGIYHGVTGVVVEPYRRVRVRAVGHHPPSSIRISSPAQQGTSKVGLANEFCQQWVLFGPIGSCEEYEHKRAQARFPRKPPCWCLGV